MWDILRVLFSFLKTCAKNSFKKKKKAFILGVKKIKMLEGKARIKQTDMPEKMQIQAMACASQALDLHDVFDCVSIASHIKKV